MEPNEKVDDRTRIGVAGATDDTVALSNFLRDQISPGGDRYDDFSALLTVKRKDLKTKRGMRACQ